MLIGSGANKYKLLINPKVNINQRHFPRYWKLCENIKKIYPIYPKSNI